jgi:hypothetical protein
MREPDPLDQAAAILARLGDAAPGPVLPALASMAAGALIFAAGMLAAAFLP